MSLFGPKTIAVLVTLPLALGVAACSSNSSNPSSSSSSTGSSSASGSASSSSSHMTTASPSVTATASPTTAKPTPTGSVKGLSLGVSSTTAKPGERINVTVSGSSSLAGKQVVLVDMLAPDKDMIFSKLTLNSSGSATGYLVLGMTDAVQAFVPTQQVSGNTWSAGTAVLAESGVVTITVK